MKSSPTRTWSIAGPLVAAAAAWVATVAAAVLLGVSLQPARAAEPQIYHGVFALPGKAAKADATLTATFLGPTKAHLVFAEADHATGKPIATFDVDMTKRMHVIVISDDFTRFEHVHPALENGKFVLDLTVPAQGGYQIYADAVPHGLGQQVFRFAVPFGSAPAATPDLAPAGRTVHAGPYAVTLSSLTLDSGKTTMLGVSIAKNGKPAQDLHPYLGGAAHAVFIGASNLSYAHVHPMQGESMGSMHGMDPSDMGEMSDLPDSAKVDPSMMLHVAVPKAGTYKLWLQFRGGGAIYVAPFVLNAA